MKSLIISDKHMIHFVVQQKLTQHCIAIILQLRKKRNWFTNANVGTGILLKQNKS